VLSIILNKDRIFIEYVAIHVEEFLILFYILLKTNSAKMAVRMKTKQTINEELDSRTAFFGLYP
jgi:hypothetical protein